jgi:Fe2+ transport system protein B
LSRELQAPIVTAVARKGRGIAELKELIIEVAEESAADYELA